MADVIISSSGTYHSTEANNGNAVTFITPVGMGSAKILTAENNVYIGSGTLVSRYTDRFDDPRYYTGDSAS
jgi:hypothetical protein|tara:strand:- start:439 stop:651 length:213 start_codon:yes stop_codon:yes gene_type:complete